jgi:anthranilate/para-aminobenzoate synthase component I/branched-subunit amino acid aminotransferase/4-amino-4-deoxychorismate lyase
MQLNPFKSIGISNFQSKSKSISDICTSDPNQELIQGCSFFLYLKSDFNHSLGKESILVWDPIIIGVLAEKNWTEYDLSSNRPPELFSPSEFQTRIPQLINIIRECIKSDETQAHFQFTSYIGLYGYTGYEAGRMLDPHKHREDHPQYPIAIYFLPRCYRIETHSHWIEFELKIEGFPINNGLPQLNLTPGNPRDLGTPFDYTTYIKTIRQIQTYIRKGDIYQANFTIPFTIPPTKLPGDQIFSELFAKNPTPYAAFFRWNQFEIISLSMELFLQIKEGKIITCPIKGTAPRGTTESEDQQNINDLQNSTKDHAELAMIVDLLRNDLSRSAKIGSVKVLDHAKLESFSNVHHLISTITAQIDPTPEASWALYLRSFPGGSITGCPKLRSMEIIEELEKIPREVYTGSIGYLTLDGTLNKNIAIRTLIKTPDQIRFNAGGGITIYSNPEQEFFEVFHKIRHFLAFFHGKRLGSISYFDGKYIPSSFIPEFERCNQQILTNGCFETILIENHRPSHLNRHMKRLSAALRYFETTLEENIYEIIPIILKLNAAENARLRIRCILEPTFEKTKYHMIIELFELTNPPEKIKLMIQAIQSVEKEIPPEVRNVGIKTLNYNVYRQATAAAQQENLWDTLLVTPEGTLLECGRATIYCFTDNKWITPQFNVIAGTIREELLTNNSVQLGTVNLKDLHLIKAIAISNALIGLKSVHSVMKDGKIFWKTQSESLLPTLNTF